MMTMTKINKYFMVRELQENFFNAVERGAVLRLIDNGEYNVEEKRFLKTFEEMAENLIAVKFDKRSVDEVITYGILWGYNELNVESTWEDVEKALEVAVKMTKLDTM